MVTFGEFSCSNCQVLAPLSNRNERRERGVTNQQTPRGKPSVRIMMDGWFWWFFFCRFLAFSFPVVWLGTDIFTNFLCDFFFLKKERYSWFFCRDDGMVLVAVITTFFLKKSCFFFREKWVKNGCISKSTYRTYLSISRHFQFSTPIKLWEKE